MTTQSYLGLPPIPSDLKSISPYVQRSDELRAQDPVISYWCAYYAAQVGISLKATAPANRAYLSGLLTVLESLRAVIGPSDAINVEAVSVAYVENFALRVFSATDNEDRRGTATRSTAKKFLAAASFLEVLKVFDDKTAWETHEEKVRYAKWKAADIAKAIREGRKPTPGPAGSQSVEATAESSPAPSAPLLLPDEVPNLTATQAQAQTQQFETVKQLSSATVGVDPANSADWSRIATPGEDGVGQSNLVGDWLMAPTPAPNKSRHMQPHVSEELEGREDEGFHEPARKSTSTLPGALPMGNSTHPIVEDPTAVHTHGRSPSSNSGSSDSSKKLRHTPKASSITNSPIVPPTQANAFGSDPNSLTTMSSSSTSASRRPESPTHFVPRGSPPSTITSLGYGVSVSAPVPPAPPPVSYGAPAVGTHPAHIPSPPSQPIHSYPTHHTYPQQPPPPPLPQELTPSLIAKAQKHCRFAISALDYEDAEQARKELLSALAILNGR